MPQKATTARKARPTKSASSSKSRGSWLQRRAFNLYSKPLMFVLAFMLVGTGTLAWASAATTTYGLWDNSKVPKIITATDRHNLELGMKFKSKVSGQVNGVRFYKSAQNTGTHTGSLWTQNGRLLATATFVNETTSGWQSVTFSQPVSIAADVTYVVSYHAPKGRYSVDFKYFNDSNIRTKDLIGQKATRKSANGVYRYSNSTRFPNEDGSGANYWVDVIFSSKVISAPTGPAAPNNPAVSVITNKSVKVSWSASASATPLAKYQVYRDNSLIAETLNSSITDSTVVAGKSYTYKVRAVDTKGLTSAYSPNATVTVPTSATPTNPTTPTPTTPTPTTPTNPPKPTTPTTPTTPTNPGNAATTNLFDAKKKEIAMQLVSSAENSSLDWKAQYGYLEDIGDGRGYTGGIIGFCSGCGDMLSLVQYYTKIQPTNGLSKYIPALQKVNGSASHTGLGAAFETAWKAAAKDAKFIDAQNYERDRSYFNPAVNQAIADGLKTLGQFIYYDAMVVHGPGSDSLSFGGIRSAAMKAAKTPAQGGNETTYLTAFMDARNKVMKTEEAHSDVSRIDQAQRVFLKAGNFYLNPPLSWSVYGDKYSITKLP